MVLPGPSGESRVDPAGLFAREGHDSRTVVFDFGVEGREVVGNPRSCDCAIDFTRSVSPMPYRRSSASSLGSRRWASVPPRREMPRTSCHVQRTNGRGLQTALRQRFRRDELEAQLKAVGRYSVMRSTRSSSRQDDPLKGRRGRRPRRRNPEDADRSICASRLANRERIDRVLDVSTGR